MKFENTAALANHQKKFCTDGEYGTMAKLDEKLKKSSVSPATMPLVSASARPANGLEEAYFREKVGSDRNQEMALELEKYKEERKKLKLESMNKEQKYLEK